MAVDRNPNSPPRSTPVTTDERQNKIKPIRLFIFKTDSPEDLFS